MTQLKSLVLMAVFAVSLIFVDRAIAQSVGTAVLDTIPSDLPRLVPTTIDNPAQGSLFYASLGSPTRSYAVISDDSGHPQYFIRATFPLLDFKVQPNGYLTCFSGDAGGFLVLDPDFKRVATIRPVGFPADNHDFRILPNGNYLMMGYDSLPNYDISQVVGGQKVVTAIGVVIQEMSPDGDVVWQWRGWDEGHFLPEDMQHPETVTASDMDAIHANSLDVDADGNILLSSRHLSEISKIDRQTGKFIWRLGGKHNEFTFVNDTLGFSYQHSARFLPNGHIMLFDNGNFHLPSFSRAVEYALDDKAKTAELVWQFDHHKSIFTQFMGNVQRLSNGNTVIGWGGATGSPAVTEVRPDGTIAYEANYSAPIVSYRVFRFPFTRAAVHTTKQLGYAVSAIAPDPVESVATFAVTSDAPRAMTVGVFDATGRLVESIWNGRMESGVQLLQLHADNYPMGAYRVVVQTADGTITQNFVH